MLPFGVPLCPTQGLLHLDCPACGATRGVLDLLRGDVVGALDHNLLLLVAVPLMAVLGLGRVRAALGHARPRRAVPAWVLPVTVVVLATFTVLRNVGPSSVAWLDAA